MIEKKVLAFLLKDKKGFEEVCQKDVTDKHFLSRGCKILFKLLKEYNRLYNDSPQKENVEYLLENSRYKKEERSDALAVYLEVLNTEIISNISFLLDSLIEENKKRILTDSLISATQNIESGTWKNSIDILKNGILKIDSLNVERLEESINTSTSLRLKRYEESKVIDRASFVPTGFPTMDRVSGGMQKGEIWVVAGWLKSGKSLMLLNIAYNAWCLGKTVLFISAELSHIQLARRFDSLACNVPYNKIKFGVMSPDEEENYRRFLEEVKKKENLFNIVFQPSCSTSHIYQKVREMKARKGLDFVVVDYLGLIHPDRKYASRDEKLGNVTLEIKDIAGIEQIPILTAHQINREGYLSGKTGAEYASHSTDVPRHADMYFSIRAANNEDNRVFINRGILDVRIEAARDCELAFFKCDVFWDRMRIQERRF